MLLLWCLPRLAAAQATPPAAGLSPAGRFVEFTASPGALSVVAHGTHQTSVGSGLPFDSAQGRQSGTAAPIVVDANDYPGVRRAAEDLQADVARVTGLEPRLLDQTPPRGEADAPLRRVNSGLQPGTAAPARADAIIVIGTLGRSSLVQTLVDRRKLDVTGIRGRWESSVIQVVERPWPGVRQALVIAGSDQRGTIYAIYDLSEQIGVSPWYWWADVPLRHRAELFVRRGRYLRGEPAVRYRGLFINDEAPALSGWAQQTFGGFNHRFYARVFELLLRLKANLVWPAMWGSAFADDDPQNLSLAGDYGVVIGTSHHEPMMRAHDEWRQYGTGPWNYATNAEALRAFWWEGVRRAAGYESIVTLGMRGDGDMPMAPEANIALLERIVADQRTVLAEERGGNLASAPQVWALYKEVQEYYEKGMRVPDDVTLLWSDDNWGNIRRLPTAEERARPGGAGVYYHAGLAGNSVFHGVRHTWSGSRSHPVATRVPFSTGCSSP